MKKRANQLNLERGRAILFTGGGTGGHIYPGLSVLQAMPMSFEYLWIGSRKGMDREIVEAAGIQFYGISSGKLRRYVSIKNILDIIVVLIGFFEALWIMARIRPKALFSKGGYVSVPPVVAAAIFGVPVVTHESDLVPGLATTINSKFADKILVAYNSSREYFPHHIRHRVITVGVPVRQEVLQGDAEKARESLGIGLIKPVLLVVGGSQGARSINNIILGCVDRLLEDWIVIHQTGNTFAIDEQSGRELRERGYYPAPYFGAEYPDILALAGIVVCRAGATTLWELSAVRKPSIVIPLGLASSRGDQVQNARIYSDAGASYVFDGEKGTIEEFLGLVDMLLDESRRKQMGEAAFSLYRGDAAILIAEEIIKSATGERE